MNREKLIDILLLIAIMLLGIFIMLMYYLTYISMFDYPLIAICGSIWGGSALLCFIGIIIYELRETKQRSNK